MKQLSVEEKAKRYDGNYKTYTELINRFEDVKEAIKKQNYGIAMDVLCKPYPEFQVTTHSELKDEDERIRKTLVEFFVDWSKSRSHFWSISIQKILSWLEKQGEQKSIVEMKSPEESLGIDSETYNIIVDECIYVEQKPTKGAKGNDREIPFSGQKWSEEDESMWAEIADLLWEGYKQSGSKYSWDNIRNWVNPKLKSLRPQNRWKPSDEQMEALENVRKILHTNDIYSKANHLVCNFEELIRTLNKLREE